MAVPTIARDVVKQKIDSGSAVVLEALPASYYQDTHLPGALNLPMDDVQTLAPELVPDKDATVIVYCANLPCPNSRVVAEQLVKLGYHNVYEYAEGKEDWVQAGLPTESGVAIG